MWEITTKLEILREFVEKTDSLQKCVTTAKTLKSLKEILFREPSDAYATEYEAEVYGFQVLSLLSHLIIKSEIDQLKQDVESLQAQLAEKEDQMQQQQLQFEIWKASRSTVDVSQNMKSYLKVQEMKNKMDQLDKQRIEQIQSIKRLEAQKVRFGKVFCNTN